ncbi:MAG: TetR/AcrR family transcriptional regulator [Alphaproteobacteria bacterium]
MLCKKTVRRKIIDAARERFFHYGYGKTTMAEVAQDCGMSPGNLYRYFPSKLDIAEEIADAFHQEMQARIAAQASAPGLSARERLRAHLFGALRLTFEKLENDARVVEVAQILARERPAYANRELARERRTLCEILEQGNAEGQFEVADPMFAAEMIQSATMKYRYPQLWCALSLEALERELDGVLSLLIDGLGGKPRRANAPV